MKNLQLPGNPRYQPKSLTEIFGYDNLYRNAIKVEFAAMHALNRCAYLPNEIHSLLTPALEASIIDSITTTIVDKVEREVTHHDVRALVRLIQEKLPEALRPYVHVPLTSYDVLDTARALQFKEAYKLSLKPSLVELQLDLVAMVSEHADLVQIGRTHGQHALPITVGFWLATILDRIFTSWIKLDNAQKNLRGKISGAVGAYNAQEGLWIDDFEYFTLEKLGLKKADISTQIMPPEYLTDFLYACLLISAALGQFGRDCRHLMRSEIAELSEAFDSGQVGSSTMAHKRNPINFENLEGMFLRNRAEFIKVTDTLISEHQRDLVGSSLMRDLPIIVINLQQQLDTLNRKKDGKSFLNRISFDKKNIERNFNQNADYILAEPLYLALQLYGYDGDAHELVNRKLLPAAKAQKTSLLDQLLTEGGHDEKLQSVILSIPAEIMTLLKNPKEYIGRSIQQASSIGMKVVNGLKNR